MYNHGVYRQALIKKQQYWTKNTPGDLLDHFFSDKELDSAKTFKQEVDGVMFLVHCHKDDMHVTKLMSTHGLIHEMPGRVTYRKIGGEWKTYNYTKPVSHHNHCTYWIDDANGRRHDPIGLENFWHTKRWSH